MGKNADADDKRLACDKTSVKNVKANNPTPQERAAKGLLPELSGKQTSFRLWRAEKN